MLSKKKEYIVSCCFDASTRAIRSLLNILRFQTLPWTAVHLTVEEFEGAGHRSLLQNGVIGAGSGI